MVNILLTTNIALQKLILITKINSIHCITQIKLMHCITKTKPILDINYKNSQKSIPKIHIYWSQKFTKNKPILDIDHTIDSKYSLVNNWKNRYKLTKTGWNPPLQLVFFHENSFFISFFLWILNQKNEKIQNKRYICDTEFTVSFKYPASHLVIYKLTMIVCVIASIISGISMNPIIAII